MATGTVGVARGRTAVVIVGELAAGAPADAEPPSGLTPGATVVDAQGVRWTAHEAILETVWTQAPRHLFTRKKSR